MVRSQFRCVEPLGPHDRMDKRKTNSPAAAPDTASLASIWGHSSSWDQDTWYRNRTLDESKSSTDLSIRAFSSTSNGNSSWSTGAWGTNSTNDHSKSASWALSSRQESDPGSSVKTPFLVSNGSSPNLSSFVDVTYSDRLDLFLSNTQVNYHISSILAPLLPSLDSKAKLEGVYHHVRSLIEPALGCKVFLVGPARTHVYTIRESEIHIAVFFTQNHQRVWGQKVMGALQRLNPRLIGSSEDPVSQQVLARMLWNGEFVDIVISNNNSVLLAQDAMKEEADRLIGKNHLFKRTIILTRFWSFYEVGFFKNSTEEVCRASGNCLVVMLFCIFNAFSSEIETPLQGLWKLIEYANQFNWKRHALSIAGPIDMATGLLVTSERYAFPPEDKRLFTEAWLAKYRPRKPKNIEPFEPKYLNMIDIRDTSLNHGHLLSRSDAETIRRGFIDAGISFKREVEAWFKRRNVVDSISGIFPNTYVSVRPNSIFNPIDTVSLQVDLSDLEQQWSVAKEFDAPDFTEAELVALVKKLLLSNGAVTVGKMGSMMHSETNCHGLPAMLKNEYGGLKKLLRRHDSVFRISKDHPHNPKVYLVSNLLSNPDDVTEFIPRSYPEIPFVSTPPQSPLHSPDQFMDTDEWLFCPLSGKLLLDPVVAPDGSTYDRVAILEWKNAHGNISPQNRYPLDLSTLYPNTLVMHFVKAHLQNS